MTLKQKQKFCSYPDNTQNCQNTFTCTSEAEIQLIVHVLFKLKQKCEEFFTSNINFITAIQS